MDSGGVKGNYVKLSSLVFERPSLKPYRYFTDVKIVSRDDEKSTRTVIQECLRMNMIINKIVIKRKEILKANFFVWRSSFF